MKKTTLQLIIFIILISPKNLKTYDLFTSQIPLKEYFQNTDEPLKTDISNILSDLKQYLSTNKYIEKSTIQSFYDKIVFYSNNENENEKIKEILLNEIPINIQKKYIKEKATRHIAVTLFNDIFHQHKIRTITLKTNSPTKRQELSNCINKKR